MSSAQERTEALVRTSLNIGLLVPNDQNPNEMGEVEFNLLYDNIERMGITDPILVRPHPEQEGFYKVIGGHHRLEVARLHGIEDIPCTVVTDNTFDDDAEKFQMVRHNVIHGKMSPRKFMKLYESLQGKYTEELAAEMFGFADDNEFRRLVQSTASSLPPEMKQSFLEASKEIKTIGDLSLVLNRLFTAFGDTLPYGYMVFDFGGQDHVWLRMKKGQKKDLMTLGNWCRERNRTIDGALTVLLQLIATEGLSQESFESQFMKLKEVSMGGVPTDVLPSEDFLSSLPDEM